MEYATPRPRPPARTRRLPSLQFPKFPPPPYAPSIDQVVLDAASSPRVLDDAQLAPPNPNVEEWMNEKSREELSNLLFKADELIKSRETGVSCISRILGNTRHAN